MFKTPAISIGLLVTDSSEANNVYDVFQQAFKPRLSTQHEGFRQFITLTKNPDELFGYIEDGTVDYGLVQTRNNGVLPAAIVKNWMAHENCRVVAEHFVGSTRKPLGYDCFHLVSRSFKIAPAEDQDKMAVIFTLDKCSSFGPIISYLAESVDIGWVTVIPSTTSDVTTYYIEVRRKQSLWHPDVYDVLSTLTTDVRCLGQFPTFGFLARD